MYSGVPMSTWAPVIPFPLTDLAMPKSMIRAFPSLSIMMFWGFRSRWTTPTRWASSRPSHTYRAMLTALPTGSAPIR